MLDCINNCTIFQIFIGCISSLIGWWLINMGFSPRLWIGKVIQYPKEDKKCVRIRNWTFFNAYDVCFTIEYRTNGNKLNSFISTGTLIPSIERGESFFLELKSEANNDKVKEFFVNPNEKSIIVITAVFQSKIGIKKRKTRTIQLNKERMYP